MSMECTCRNGNPDCTASSHVCVTKTPPTGPVFPVTTRKVEKGGKK